MGKGWIYILINPSFKEDALKIGRTSRSPEERAAELSTSSGVPTKFLIAYKQFVSDCEQVEKLVHKRLNQYRINDDREFFQVCLSEAIKTILDLSEPFQIEIQIDEAEDFENHSSMFPQEMEVMSATAFVEMKCPKCFGIYKVTLTRYEQIQKCPSCRTQYPISIKWCWPEK